MTTAAEPSLLDQLQSIRLSLDELGRWLARPPISPIPPADMASIRDAVGSMSVRLAELEADPTILAVVIVGGTGVGKSTLLNALAGERIAQSGIVRPTTQHPTVYHHAEVRVELLPPPFRECRLVSHERPELRYKILIDTPDMDGAVVEHHQRLREILPVADAVLFVGSAEKYHDRAAWKILVEHAATRAFAFVLNKWDRCLAAHHEATGSPPDVDFQKSLREAGFESPLLFRTCGKQWEVRRLEGVSNVPLIEDDFEALCQWIERELDERAIRDIKARGMECELEKLVAAIDSNLPLDWPRKLERLRGNWREMLRSNVADHAVMLLDAASTQSSELEQHFGGLGTRGVDGLFGLYLRTGNRLGRLRDFWSGGKGTEIQKISAKCTKAIPTGARQTRRDAFRDHLLMAADRDGWPIEALRGEVTNGDSTDDSFSLLDDAQLAEALAEEMIALEKDYTAPEGGKRLLQALIRFLCRWLPMTVLVTIGLWLGYRLMTIGAFGLWAILGSAACFIATIASLHILWAWAFPMKWESLRGDLLRRVERNLLDRAGSRYLEALERLAGRLAAERQILCGALTILKRTRDHLRRQIPHASTLFARRSR